MANVGKQIKKLRMVRSMTQDDLAEQLFVSRQTVSNYETGKSNPDIDMLLHIAQVFETDVNSLIYGPPVPSDRKREKRRAMILTAMTAALAGAMAFLIPWAKEYLRETFIAMPSYWLYYIGWPLLMLLIGWTALELAGSFLGAKGPKWRRSKWVRWGLIGLLLIYGAMAVPFLIWTVRCSLSVLRAGSVSSIFSFPLGIRRIWSWTYLYPGLFRSCFALMGAGLWLTRRKKPPEPTSEVVESSEPEQRGLPS